MSGWPKKDGKILIFIRIGANWFCFLTNENAADYQLTTNEAVHFKARGLFPVSQFMAPVFPKCLFPQ